MASNNSKAKLPGEVVLEKVSKEVLFDPEEIKENEMFELPLLGNDSIKNKKGKRPEWLGQITLRREVRRSGQDDR